MRIPPIEALQGATLFVRKNYGKSAVLRNATKHVPHIIEITLSGVFEALELVIS